MEAKKERDRAGSFAARPRRLEEIILGERAKERE